MWFNKIKSSQSTFKKKRNTYINDPISPFLGCILLNVKSLMVEYTTNQNGELMHICTKEINNNIFIS